MDYHQFIKNVQERAHLSSKDEALNVTRATLETLGERLFQETEQLAAQLPADLANFLTSGTSNQKYEFDEFLQRIGEREGTDPQTARQHAEAVIEVLSEAVTEGEIEDVIEVLPKEYRQLFEKHTKGTIH